VLIAGDDGVPVRVREELAGAGVPTMSICSSAEVRAARAATAAGARVVIGDVSAAATWEAAGIQDARSVGILGADDLANLSAALQVADEAARVRIVVRLFSSDLAEGVEAMLGGRGTVLSEIDVAAPALIQAALSGNEGQRITVGGRVLEVAEVDRDDPALVVALCDVDTPTDILPPRDRLGRNVLGLVDRASVVTGARGALPASVAQYHRAPQRPKRSSRSDRRRLDVLHRDDGDRRLRRREPTGRARLAEAVRHRADGGLRGAAGVGAGVCHRPTRELADRPCARAHGAH
jgi:voltage-gated potassium channel Kch